MIHLPRLHINEFRGPPQWKQRQLGMLEARTAITETKDNVSVVIEHFSSEEDAESYIKKQKDKILQSLNTMIDDMFTKCLPVKEPVLTYVLANRGAGKSTIGGENAIVLDIDLINSFLLSEEQRTQQQEIVDQLKEDSPDDELERLKEKRKTITNALRTLKFKNDYPNAFNNLDIRIGTGLALNIQRAIASTATKHSYSLFTEGFTPPKVPILKTLLEENSNLTRIDLKIVHVDDKIKERYAQSVRTSNIERSMQPGTHFGNIIPFKNTYEDIDTLNGFFKNMHTFITETCAHPSLAKVLHVHGLKASLSEAEKPRRIFSQVWEITFTI